jgi:CAAX prenyl protease-like protein
MAEHDEHPRAATAAPRAPLLNREGWACSAPFLAYLAFIAASDLLLRLGLAPAGLRWLYALRIGTVMALLAVGWRRYAGPGLVGGARLPAWPALVALGAGVLVLVLWVSLNADWMILGQPAGFDPRNAGVLDWPLVVVRIFGAAAVVPLMEELFWRGFLLRWIDTPDFTTLDPAQASWKSIAVTVVLFGFEHNQWLAGIVAGLIYTALYVRYRTLWAPILAHAVTNFLLGIWVVHTGNWSYW